MQYAWKAPLGLFQIRREPTGWMIWFGDDRYDGPFRTPQQALDNLSGGHGPSLPGGVDAAIEDMPDQIEDWSAR